MFFSDESDDLITCPHCGHSEYPQVGIGHICPLAPKSGPRHVGKRLRIQMFVEIEVSEADLGLAISDIEHKLEDLPTGSRPVEFKGGDDILKYQWKTKCVKTQIT